jgi:hypothetical protein
MKQLLQNLIDTMADAALFEEELTLYRQQATSA